MKQRIFVDMDGTLCEWKYASIEEVAAKGYFLSLAPQQSVVNAVKKLIQTGKYEVIVLSSVFNDDHSIQEKNEWLDQHLPELKKRIYVPYGEKKKDFIANKEATDVLLDDFSKNLHEWHGIGIKVMNGVNGTKGTWKGFLVNGLASEDVIYKTLIGITLAA